MDINQIARELRVPERALEIILWHSSASVDEIKEIVARCLHNKSVSQMLHNRWFALCETQEDFMRFYSELPQQRILKTNFFDQWCSRNLNSETPLQVLLALSGRAPYGSKSQSLIVRLIRARTEKRSVSKSA